MCIYMSIFASLSCFHWLQYLSNNIIILFQSLNYLILISEVEEVEIFKICLEYWNSLAADLYRESPFSGSSSPLLLGKAHNELPVRRQLYNPVLSRVSLLYTTEYEPRQANLCLRAFRHYKF